MVRTIEPTIDDHTVTVWWASDRHAPGACVVRRWKGNHRWELHAFNRPGDWWPSRSLHRKAEIMEALRGMGVTLG